MRKKRTAFLAAFLALCMMIPTVGVPVRAAGALSLSADFNYTMTEGVTNSIPVLQAGNLGSTQMRMRWSFVDTFGASVTTGTFFLRYAIDSEQFVQMKVERIGSRALVTYDVFSQNDYTNKIPTVEYSVHSNQGAVAGAGHYIAPAAHPNNVTTADYYVDPTALASPTFMVQQNNGFSFRYNGRNVHFLWTGEEMNVVTDGVLPGRLYEFFIGYSTGGTAPAFPSAFEGVKVVNGLAPNTMQITTLAGGNSSSELDISDVLDWADMTPPSSDVYQVLPAQDENKIRVQFDLPVKIGADGKYTAALGSADIADLGLELRLTSSISGQRQIMISDLFIPRIDGTAGVTVSNGSNDVTVAVTATPRRTVVITIGGLQAGQIFNDSYIQLTSSDKSILLRRTVVSDYSLYTFAKYEIVYQSGKFRVIVHPYKGYKGFYMLLIGNAPAMIMQSDGEERLFMPLNLNAADSIIQTYQILFSPTEPFKDDLPSDRALRSQLTEYKASTDKISVGVPGNFEIVKDKLTLVAPEIPNADKLGDLSLLLRWNIGDQDEIIRMMDNRGVSEFEIVYDLQRTLTPAEKPEARDVFAQLSVKITKDGSNKLSADYSIISANPAVTIKTPHIDDMSAEAGGGIFDPDTNITMIRALVELETRAAHEFSALANYKFYYPNIYFINAKPVTVQYGAGAVENLSELESLYDTLTLDDLSKLEVPPPQELAITDPALDPAGTTSLRVNWLVPGAQIKEYVDSMYAHTGVSLAYNMYIAHSEKALKDVLAKPQSDRKTGLDVWTFDDTDVSPDADGIGTIDLSALEADGSTDRLLEILRENKVVCISDIFVTDPVLSTTILTNGDGIRYVYKLGGLDQNQTYYVILDAVMTFQPGAPVGAEPMVYVSKATGIVAETTPSDEITPQPEDMAPPAPVLDKEDIGLSDATILWAPVENVPGGETQYEMIRMKNIMIPNELLDTKIEFGEFFNNKTPAAAKVGLRTSDTPFGVLEWNGSAFGAAPADISRFEYKPGEPTRVLDKTLSPNSLYFYYVRTVRTIGDKTLYSPWSVISVTTTPVQPPINLEVVRYGVTHDPKHQVVITFDAPIPSLLGLGTDYEMQVSLKRDMDPWGNAVTLTAAQLISTTATPGLPGYYRLTYIISGLAHGTAYGIRVRMRDVQQGDFSVYSNIAETRTDFDQQDYDSQKDVNDWVSYLKELLAERVKYEYWDASQSGTFRAVYRPSMWSRVMSRSIDSTIRLAESPSPYAEYYIPASALLAANSAGKGFVFTFEDVETILSPRMINTNENEAVLKAAQRIKDKAAADYFVRITVSWIELGKDRNGYDILVDGNTPASREITVELDLITVKQDITAWDGGILMYALDYLSTTGVHSQLETLVKAWRAGKMTDEEMVIAAEEAVDKIIETSLTARVRSELTRVRDQQIPVTSLSAPILLKLMRSPAIKNQVVKGYRRMQPSLWSSQDLILLGDIWTISAMTTGSYIFTRALVSLPGLSSLPSGGALLDLIMKYGLDDYLGKGSAFNLNAPVSTYMVSGVAARLAGAARTADPVSWLRGRGYTAISARSGAVSTNQETVYILMALYEIRTGAKISTMQIRNYSLTAGMQLDNRFLKSVQAAYELGVCTNKNMQPTATPTVRELLNMLSGLQQKIKL